MLLDAFLFAQIGHTEKGFEHFDDDRYESEEETPHRGEWLVPVPADGDHRGYGEKNEYQIQNIAQPKKTGIPLSFFSSCFFEFWMLEAFEDVG